MKKSGFHSHSFWVTLSKLFDFAVPLFSQLSNAANTFKGHEFCELENINTCFTAQILQGNTETRPS